MRELTATELQAAAGGQGFIDTITDVSSTAMMAGGAAAGAAVGALGGPLAAAQGALIGGSIGWLTPKVVRSFAYL